MKVKEKYQNRRQASHHRAWRQSPLVGYPFAVLFAAAAFLIPLSERSLGFQDYFIVPPFVIATFLVGWLWGIGPALVTLLLEVLALDYWFVPPLGEIDFFLWPDITSFVPFILIQLIVLGMVIVQKKYRQQLLSANEELAKSMQVCTESNAQLEQAHRIKDQFLSMASHELRTPITSIQGYIQLLLRRLKKQSTHNPELLSVYDSLGKVDEQIRRLTELMNDLLDINTFHSGKMPLCLVPCDLCVLCRGVVEERRTLTDRQLVPGVNAVTVFVQTGQRLAALLQSYDARTSAHCARVSWLAEETGRHLGAASEALFLMRLGGFCHDLGKIGIPNPILRKPGSLIGEEWTVMQLHAEMSARILGHMGGFFQWAAPVVRAHHERWDGRGYPQGLKGEEIPLASRVIAVVDAYDTMMSRRSYKEPIPVSVVEAELCRAAGTQFDPAVVHAFLSVLKRPDFDWSHLSTRLDWDTLVQEYIHVFRREPELSLGKGSPKPRNGMSQSFV